MCPNGVGNRSGRWQTEQVVAALMAQLGQMHQDLVALMERDPEQEVVGSVFPLLDAVLSEAREALPTESTLRSQVVWISLTRPLSPANPYALPTLSSHAGGSLVGPGRLELPTSSLSGIGGGFRHGWRPAK